MHRRSGVGRRLDLPARGRYAACVLGAALVLLGAGAAHADGSAAQQVTVTVERLSTLSLTGGDVTLTIPVDPGSSGPYRAADDSTCALTWLTNVPNQKITVASDLASPQYTLSVTAVDPTKGSRVGEVRLDAESKDLLTAIPRGAGSCVLKYAAWVLEAVPPGREVHLVTYTITDGS